MMRIFGTVAAIDFVALVAAFAVGHLSQLQGAGSRPDHPTYLVHFVLGLTAVLGTLLVHCLSMTYFLGTGRLVKEVTLAYDLPDMRWARPTRDLKRDNTPKAIAAMPFTIAAAAAGEAER